MTTKTRNQETWDNRIQALAVFASREGHALVPSGHTEGDTNLGSWVSYLRTLKHSGRLSTEKVTQIESFKGWEWGPLRPGPKPDVARDTAIKERREGGETLSVLASAYGLSRQRIHQIVGTNE